MDNRLINIPPYITADICWPLFHNHVQVYQNDIASDLEKILQSNEQLRVQADYNTGSISFLDAYNLVSLSAFFGCQSAAEVGTFIGNSTNAIAYGMIISQTKGTIYTCDSSNTIDINVPFEDIEIKQYQKQSSTDMLRSLKDNNIKVDMLYLGGRLQAADFELLPHILAENAIITLDDYEGIEKGVVNMTALTQIEMLQQYIIVYPQENNNYLSFVQNPREKSRTALMIPISRFQFTRQ